MSQMIFTGEFQVSNIKNYFYSSRDESLTNFENFYWLCETFQGARFPQIMLNTVDTSCIVGTSLLVSY